MTSLSATAVLVSLRNALRDATKNGCLTDYLLSERNDIQGTASAEIPYYGRVTT